MRSLLPSRLYYGWVMVASALAINAVSSTLNPVVFSFLIGPMSRDLGVPKSALAWSLTLRLLAAGCTGPMLGVLIDRHGARWLGVVSGAIAGAMLVALASAHHLWIVYAMFAMSGVAGLGGPSGQLLTQVPLAKWFVAQRGRAMAISTMGMAVGTIVAVPITQWLIETVGWHGATVTFGCVVIGVVVPVSALFIRRAPEDMGLHPDGAEGPPLAYATQTPMRAMRLVTETDWTVRQAMRTPAMWLLLGALALAGVSVTGTLVYRVDFWRSTGMSPGLVGFGTLLDPLCVVFSAFAFGMVADRVPIRYLGFAGLLGLAASIVPMVFSSGQTITIILHGATWGVAAGPTSR